MAIEMFNQSVDAFFKSEYRKLVNYVRKNMEKRYADVSPEDIVQDVALGLLNKLNVDAQIENMAAYIYRSLRNKIVDNQQKKRRNVSIEDFVKGGNVLDKAIDLIDEGHDNLNEYEPHQLMKAIEKLKVDEQYIIISTYFDGKSFQQLSDELNTPIGTLLSRKHRAQAKLAKLLHESMV